MLKLFLKILFNLIICSPKKDSYCCKADVFHIKKTKLIIKLNFIYIAPLQIYKCFTNLKKKRTDDLNSS